MPKNDYISILLEEYKALRQESLRIAGILSNTIWIAISGFIITIGAFINAAKNYPDILGWLPLILCVQSFSATSMYLSETLKYVRIGVYIREKIEESLSQHYNLPNKPMHWETWINNERATIYYMSSLFLMQLPVIITSFIFLYFIFNGSFSPYISSISIEITKDIFTFSLTLIILAINFLVTFYMSLKIIKMKNKKIKTINIIASM